MQVEHMVVVPGHTVVLEDTVEDMVLEAVLIVATLVLVVEVEVLSALHVE